MDAQDWVFLDLETTGLDPRQDKIIEIAALGLTKSGEKSSFYSLVSPGIPLPPHIVRLTGIDDGMLEGAPAFWELEESLWKFLEGKTIVAHQASFDIGFLQEGLGRPLNNKQVDTCELAKLLVPGSSSYSLRYLTKTLNLKADPTHRAMADTLALEALFNHLFCLAEKLPLKALQGVVECLQNSEQASGQGLTLLFQQILAEKIRSFSFTDSPIFREKQDTGAEEEPASPGMVEWNIEKLEKLFLPGGAVADAMPHYHKRTEQLKMLKSVARAFSQERHLVVEAGTGVGKSLAYLVPALNWAAATGEKVVVATHTIALQEQLQKSEISFLRNKLPFSFRATVFKGRSNYLCLHKWTAARAAVNTMNWQERLLTARIVLWLEQDGTGDRDNIHLNGWEKDFFAQISAGSDHHCLGAPCPYYRACFYQKARQKAHEAQVIIVNHALLLSDLRVGETILPQHHYLIVDEAHHLEEEGTRQFSDVFSLRDLNQRISLFQRRRGFSANQGLLQFWKSLYAGREAARDDLKRIQRCEELLRKVSKTLEEMVNTHVARSSQETIRLTARTRAERWWENLALLLDNLALETGDLLEALQELYPGLASDVQEAEEEKALKDLRLFIKQQEADLSLIRRFLSGNEEDKVYWLERDAARLDLRFWISPLKTGGLFFDLLFSGKNSAVLTSATLSVNGGFEFLIEQLGLPEDLVDTVQIPSPFFYDEQSLLAVDTSLPDPAKTSEECYSLAVSEALLEIIRVTRGNTLVLFTSHRQMRLIFESLYNLLRQDGLELFADGVNGHRHLLLQELKNNSQAVVFGTNTFWEGIDLPGRALTSLIIVRLPFNPPHLPIVEARLEELKKEGKDGFSHYSLPQAVIRFRQGYGRLIRTLDDCGVAVVLDNRLVKKAYGKTFINSLPEQKLYVGNTGGVAEQIRLWFDHLKLKK